MYILLAICVVKNSECEMRNINYFGFIQRPGNILQSRIILKYLIRIFRHSLLIALLLSSPSAQESEYTYSKLINNSPAYLADGFTNTFTESQSQIILGSAAVMAAGANRIDQKVHEYFLTESILPPSLAKFGDIYGKYGAPFLLVSTILIDSHLNDIPNIERSEKLEYAIWGYTANGIATYGLKFLFNRKRPDKSNNRSFPSGHTSTSFYTASTIDILYGTGPAIITYLMSTVVGISRIQDEYHYLSDVIFGAGLGIAISKGFAYVYRKTHRNNSEASPSFNINYTFPL